MLRDARTLGRHVWVVWRAGQLRFRLETFGLYFPSVPYSRAWWRPNLQVLLKLARQGPAYAKWVLEMERLRREGAAAWWRDWKPIHRDCP